jgi:hypothetical protein
LLIDAKIRINLPGGENIMYLRASHAGIADEKSRNTHEKTGQGVLKELDKVSPVGVHGMCCDGIMYVIKTGRLGM